MEVGERRELLVVSWEWEGVPLEVAFDRLDLAEIVSFTTLGNQRSRAVMQRVGMREAGRFEHPSIPIGHPLRAHCLYRLSQVDYRAQRIAGD